MVITTGMIRPMSFFVRSLNSFVNIGNPLVGDGKYGVNRDAKRGGYKYQALCSYYLEFDTDGFFSYLNGRAFTVKKESVYFLSLFDGVKLPIFGGKK